MAMYCGDKGAGRHVPPINVKFYTGERTVPNFIFIGAEIWDYFPRNRQNLEFRFRDCNEMFGVFACL